MNNEKITVRKARGEEIIEMLSMLAKDGIYHSEDIYLLVYENYPDLMLVAEKNGEIIGFVVGALSDESTGRILVLFVRRGCRGKGVGSILLREIIKVFQFNYGVKTITLEVHEKNEVAIRLYEKFGFKKVRKLPGYYNGEDGWLMVKRLLP